MKHMKKLCALVLAIMLMAAFSTAASAAEVQTGGLLYEYDPASAGEIWQSFTGSWTYDENGISVANDGNDVWFYTYMGIDEGWTDYVIELDLVNVAEGGVIFRCTDPAPGIDTFGGYIIAYDSAYCFVGMDDNDNWKTLPDDGPDAPAAAAMNYAAQMHWKIIVQGNTYTLYVDDLPIPFVQVQDESYTQGGIGLRAKVFEGDDSGYFQNVKVYELEEEAPLLEIPGIERGEVLYKYDPATAKDEWTAHSGTWTYDENGINIVNDGNDVWYFSYVGIGEGWTDYIMELDLVNLPEAGVIFRCEDPGPGIDTFDGYYLGYDSAYAIIGMDDGNDQWELLREDGPDAPAAAVLNYAAKMHWTIVVQGDKYTLYVDDLPLPYIQVQDDTHMEGGIGVRGKFLPDDTPGYFQNVTVYELKTTGDAPAADPDPEPAAAPDPEPETTPDTTPEPTENTPAESSGGMGWIWIVVVIAVVAAAAAVVVLRKKKDGK